MEIEVPVEKNNSSAIINRSDAKTGFRLDSFGRSQSGSSLDSLLLENNEPMQTSDSSFAARDSNSSSRLAASSSKSGPGGDDAILSYRAPRMLRIAVVGESTAGKTSICESICADYPTFSEKYRLTCGVEIYAKTMSVIMKSKDNNTNENNADDEVQSVKLVNKGPTDSLGRGAIAKGRRSAATDQLPEKVNLILLDSSGKDLYIDLLPKYWGKIDGFILVVDLTCKNALESAVPWLELAQQSLILNDSKNSKEQSESAMKTSILIGNKSDLTNQRVIKTDSAKEFANKYGLGYFESSVKINQGIQEAFEHLAKSGLTVLAQQNSATKLGKQFLK